MTDAPATMSAWTHSQAGIPASVLTFRDDIQIPRLTSPAQVLVKISHASLNPGASIMIQFAPTIFRVKPCIPELDFAGTVVKAAEEVPEELREPGTAVFGSVLVPAHMKGVGTLAEYLIADTSKDSNVLVLPRGDIPPEQAAGLGVAGCTALTMVEKANLKKGMRVLLNGASGGIGSMTLQLVRGAIGREGTIVAIASARNAETVTALGADEVRTLTLWNHVLTCYRF